MKPELRHTYDPDETGRCKAKLGDGRVCLKRERHPFHRPAPTT